MLTLVSATNREGSRTRIVVSYFQEVLESHNQPYELLDFRDLPRDFLFSDLYGERSEAFQPIADLVERTDRFMFVVPEYNGSIPGVVKSFIDAFNPKKYFYDKKASLAGVSAGHYGNIRGIEHLTGMLNYIRINVLPYKLHIMRIDQKIDDTPQLVEDFARQEVERQVEAFLQF